MRRVFFVLALAASLAVPVSAAHSASPEFICGGTARPCPSPGFIDDGSRDAVRPGNIRRQIEQNRRSGSQSGGSNAQCGSRPANANPNAVRTQPGC